MVQEDLNTIIDDDTPELAEDTAGLKGTDTQVTTSVSDEIANKIAELNAREAALEADRESFEQEKAQSVSENRENDKERDERIAKERRSEIDARTDLTEKEKEILKLHDQGVQLFEIAKRVYEFVSHDTVGTVILTIRKEHADDFSEVEDINSTKGYSGL